MCFGGSIFPPLSCSPPSSPVILELPGHASFCVSHGSISAKESIFSLLYHLTRPTLPPSRRPENYRYNSPLCQTLRQCCYTSTPRCHTTTGASYVGTTFTAQISNGSLPRWVGGEFTRLQFWQLSYSCLIYHTQVGRWTVTTTQPVSTTKIFIVLAFTYHSMIVGLGVRNLGSMQRFTKRSVPQNPLRRGILT